MTKKYISLLRLLVDVRDMVGMHNGINIYMPGYQDVERQFGVRPFSITDKQLEAQKKDKEQKHALDIIREQITAQERTEKGIDEEEKENPWVMEIQMQRNVPGFRNVHPSLVLEQRFLLPYFLEYDYLKSSDFQLGEDEWEMVHQMMVANVGTWLHAAEDLGIEGLTCMEKLEHAGYIYEVDTEKDPEFVERTLKEIYTSYFTPFETSFSRYRKNQIGKWMVASVSSKDILETMGFKVDSNWDQMTDEMPVRNCVYYCGIFLLHLPYFMTFSLLERETKTFKEYDYLKYKRYCRLVPSWLKNEEQDTEEYHLFSYGYVSTGFTPHADEYRDSNVLAKIIYQVLQAMKSLAADQNITTISIENEKMLANEDMTKAIILLNAKNLSWEGEKKND